MAAITHVVNPWRSLLLQEASYEGVVFHVETGARMSGRRVVVHEYPKKDIPYSEDMGRQAIRIHFSAYLIYRPNGPYDYVVQRGQLLNALEKDGAGILIHPVFTGPSGLKVMVERYTIIENRQRGGFSEFELMFVELGKPGNATVQADMAGTIDNNANGAEKAATDYLTEAQDDYVSTLPLPRYTAVQGGGGIT